jgi:adenylate cyclase
VETFRQMRDANPFEGKIAFIGASAAELQDLKRTPFYAYSAPGQERRFREMPGVEVHVNAFQTLLDGTYIRNVPVLWEAGLVLLLMLGVFLLSNRTNLTIATIGSAALVLLITVVDYYLFIQHRTWLALVAPVLGIILAYIATTAWQYILEQKEKAMIRGMFSQYVPKKVVDELIVNPDMLKLGGERRRMTVLFTDIAGFTAISERLNPEEIVQLLNDYLSAMSQIILDNEGIIDKYEGDLIMAEWGAPVYFEEHAVYACRSALKMQRRLAELRKEWKAQGMPELQSRIGINTGHMVVGNMGCLEVFDYTVMGDAVNLASRLEGANRLYLSTIMVGEETYEDVKDRFVLRELDTIRVRGRAEAARVYELLAEKEEDLPPGRLEALRLYGEALDLYREGKFQEALEPLEKAIQAYPADGPSRALQRRCEQFVQSPPDRIWDGIWMLTEK